MGKHFSPKELDVIHAGAAGKLTAAEICRRLQAARRKLGKQGPHPTAVERALKGKTFQRARVEPRGRKAVLTQLNLRTLDATRKRLIAKAKGEYEVHWGDVIHAARVPTAHRTTAARALSEAGYGIEWRTPRLKPDRSDMDEESGTLDFQAPWMGSGGTRVAHVRQGVLAACATRQLWLHGAAVH